MCDLDRVREDPQCGKPPVRSPFLSLVTLVLPGLGVPISKAQPKLLRILLRLLHLGMEECGRAF